MVVRVTRREPAVANLAGCGDNQGVVKKLPSRRDKASPAVERAPFSPGALVVVTLSNPRDKFWGMILVLAPEGLSVSGIELASVEDLAVMVKGGELFTPSVVFFPMHRIHRIELDLPDGDIPSLSQRFQAKTGQEPAAVLGSRGDGTTKADASRSDSRSDSGRGRA
ncbi:MAG: hypothetical protein WAN60_22250 [Candidatus Sulfotelmatobacter sp.]